MLYYYIQDYKSGSLVLAGQYFKYSLVVVACVLFAALSVSAKAQVNVVVSIKPLHSLVSGVMVGVGEPHLIIDGLTSPHAYNLKPSAAQKLQDADFVFWMGSNLERFLEKPLATFGGGKLHMSMFELENLKALPLRDSGKFEAHDHADDPGHEAEQIDTHVWLDPENAKVMVNAIADALAEVDPDHEQAYQENARSLLAELGALDLEIRKKLRPVQQMPFVVFHDAYQYFEHRYDLQAVGTLTVNSEIAPGAARIKELQDRSDLLGAVCIFSEPQFGPGIVESMATDSRLKIGILDPMGSSIKAGKNQYVIMMQQLASSFSDCLSP